MSCDDPTAPDVVAYRGLCLRHAVELAANLDLDEAGFHPHDPVYQRIIEALKTQERCDDCPVFDGETLYTIDWKQTNTMRLGAGCAREARSAATEVYPHSLPSLWVGVEDLALNGPLSWVLRHADQVIAGARAAIVNNWPACERCPVLPPPAMAAVDRRVEAEVFRVLEIHGVPLNGSDLVAAVKKLNNNNRRTVLEKMEADGLIVMERRGTAKFYSLPA